jgi:hypothetical protein
MRNSRQWARSAALAGAVLIAIPAGAQVFVVGEKSATADVNTDFRPTHVELPDDRMTERGRRELIRDLEAEQGFAHRVLPLGATVTLQANGVLTPGAEAYKKLLYEKGTSAAVGDRVVVSALEVKGDKILIDLNGGPYAKHRFLRHIQIGVGGAAVTQPNLNDGQTATGCRVTLVFEGGVPEVSAPEVKALLYPLVDFSVKSGVEAYADTLPAPVKQAIATHEVLVGMSRQMVLAALGAPESKVRESDENGRYEEWIYGHQPQTIRFVRFEGDRVSMVKIAKLGRPIEIHDQDELAGYLPPKPTKIITEGDRQGEDAAKHGAPSLKNPGEVLPDAVDSGAQNGKVQYPVAKKTDPAAATPGSSAPATTTPGATPPPGQSQNFSQASLE